MYQKGLKNIRADILSKQQEYSSKPTVRPRAILRKGYKGIKYNHKLLAIIVVVENKELEQQIKDTYKTDKCITRILKELTIEFHLD